MLRAPTVNDDSRAARSMAGQIELVVLVIYGAQFGRLKGSAHMHAG